MDLNVHCFDNVSGLLSFTCSDTVNAPADTDAHNSQDATLAGGDDIMLLATAEREKASKRYVTELVL